MSDACPAIGVYGVHSDEYGDDGDGACKWCGERPSVIWVCGICNSYALTLEELATGFCEGKAILCDANTVETVNGKVVKAWAVKRDL